MGRMARRTIRVQAAVDEEEQERKIAHLDQGCRARRPYPHPYPSSCTWDAHVRRTSKSGVLFGGQRTDMLGLWWYWDASSRTGHGLGVRSTRPTRMREEEWKDGRSTSVLNTVNSDTKRATREPVVCLWAGVVVHPGCSWFTPGPGRL